MRTESEKNLDRKFFVKVEDRDWYWKVFLPEGENRDHPACNVFEPRGRILDLLNFPKSLVFMLGLDPLQDWQLAYVVGLKKSGKEVKVQYLKDATIGFMFLIDNDFFFVLMDEIKCYIHS